MTKNKDLSSDDIKIGTKDQVVWETVKRNCVEAIQGAENELLIQREVLKLAEKKIAEETQSLNS